MSRKGKVSGHHAFWTKGNVHQIEDENHILWLGEFTGPFLNDEGEGFIHGSAWRCPGINEMVDGKTTEAHGYCTVTDGEGDEAFLKWRADPSARAGELKGKSWWTGGTGKYKGLKGENEWEIGHQIMPKRPGEEGAVGFSNFRGEYEIPDDEDC